MEMLMVSAVAVLSMPGIFLVGVLPAALGGGMAVLLLAGLLDGQFGGRIAVFDDKDQAKGSSKQAA